MRVQRTAFEVLRDFPSARPPLELLIDLFPRIRPRPYSIASAHCATPHRLALCIAHVQYTSRSKYPRVGLCSSFLARAEPGYRIALRVCPGSFKAPQLNTPLIMVGPGTGIAPLRAIYLHRAHARAHGEVVSSTDALFFGCRDENDWLYKVWSHTCNSRFCCRMTLIQNEMLLASKNGDISCLGVAFSRQQVLVVVPCAILPNALCSVLCSDHTSLNLTTMNVSGAKGVRAAHNSTACAPSFCCYFKWSVHRCLWGSKPDAESCVCRFFGGFVSRFGHIC